MNIYYTPYTCSKYLMSPNPKYKVNNISKILHTLCLVSHHCLTPVNYTIPQPLVTWSIMQLNPRHLVLNNTFTPWFRIILPMLCVCQLIEVVECLYQIIVLYSSMLYLAPTY